MSKKTSFKCVAIAAFACIASCQASLVAQLQTMQQQVPPQQTVVQPQQQYAQPQQQYAQPQQQYAPQTIQQPQQQMVVNPDLQASQIAAQQWLTLLDQGKYSDTWNAGAKTFQLTIKPNEWVRAMDGLRKPMGNVTSRELVEQRTAKDPKGLPAGDYMVLFYKTSFQNRPNANELITMVKESDGAWRVLTYQHN